MEANEQPARSRTPRKGAPRIHKNFQEVLEDPMQQTKQERPAGGSGSVEFTDILAERRPGQGQPDSDC